MNDPMQPGFNPKVFNIFDAWEVFAVNSRHNDCEEDAQGGDLPRPGGLQLQPVHHQRRSGLHGPLRDGRPDPGHLQHLPQHAERRRQLGHPHGGHRHRGRAELQPGPADAALSPGSADPTQTRRICDLGRGTTGVWTDLAKFRIPPLRGLAARAPYFHDGQAKNISAAIRYHEDRFNIDLSHGKRKDLEAFLGAL